MMIMFCKHYGIAKARDRKCTKDLLYYQLNCAIQSGNTSETQRIKSEMNKILILEANGINQIKI